MYSIEPKDAGYLLHVTDDGVGRQQESEAPPGGQVEDGICLVTVAALPIRKTVKGAGESIHRLNC